jgi:hypothetical protein
MATGGCFSTPPLQAWALAESRLMVDGLNWVFGREGPFVGGKVLILLDEETGQRSPSSRGAAVERAAVWRTVHESSGHQD